MDPAILTLLLPMASLTCLNMVIRLSVGRSKTRWGVIAFNYLNVGTATRHGRRR